jgi:site-specific DNA recombinase
MAAKIQTTETKRCAIYTRKSHEKGLDQDFNSLDAQRETCARYIQTQPGWTVLDETYEDGGFTGKNTDRPAFQRLLADVDAGKVDVIVVYKLDRFSRSLLDFLKLQEELDRRGCGVVSVTQNFNTADAMGRLILNVLMSFAQFEREMTAERIRDKVSAARRRGKWTGGPVPFGFDVKDKKLVPNETEAATVRRMFELFLEHHQMPVVARVLNQEARLPRVDGGEARWTKASVRRLLRNPLYAGLCRAGDELVQGEHEPLVDVEVYRRAQDLLDGRVREHQEPGRNDDYVLQGLLRCACGAALTPMGTRKNGREYRYYRCSGRNKKGSESCSARNMPAAELEQLVATQVMAQARSELPVGDVERAILARVEAKRREIEEAKATLPAQIAAAQAKASQYFDDLAGLDGRAREIGEQKLQRQVERLEALEKRLAEANSALEALDTQQADAGWTARVLTDLGRIWDVLSPLNKKRLLRALVDEIRVCDDRIDLRIAVLSDEEQAA